MLTQTSLRLANCGYNINIWLFPQHKKIQADFNLLGLLLDLHEVVAITFPIMQLTPFAHKPFTEAELEKIKNGNPQRSKEIGTLSAFPDEIIRHIAFFTKGKDRLNLRSGSKKLKSIVGQLPLTNEGERNYRQKNSSVSDKYINSRHFITMYCKFAEKILIPQIRTQFLLNQINLFKGGSCSILKNLVLIYQIKENEVVKLVLLKMVYSLRTGKIISDDEIKKLKHISPELLITCLKNFILFMDSPLDALTCLIAIGRNLGIQVSVKPPENKQELSFDFMACFKDLGSDFSAFPLPGYITLGGQSTVGAPKDALYYMQHDEALQKLKESEVELVQFFSRFS